MPGRAMLWQPHALERVALQGAPLVHRHGEQVAQQVGLALHGGAGHGLQALVDGGDAPGDGNSNLTKPQKASDQNKVKQDKPAPNADRVDNRVKADPLDHDHDGRRGGHIDNRGNVGKK